VFTRIAPGRACASAAASIRWRVPAVAGQCSDTTSLVAISSASVAHRSAPTSAASAVPGRRVEVAHAHAEAVVRAARQRLPDAPEPTTPTVSPPTEVPSSCDGFHPVQRPARRKRSPLPQPPRGHEDERHRDVGGVVGEHARRVGDREAVRARRVEVHVVHADAEVRQQARPQPAARRLREHGGVQPVGDGAQHRVGAGQRLDQRVGVGRAVLGGQPQVVGGGEAGLDLGGEAAGHGDDGAHERAC
jgi:hypothetical protein